MDSTRINRVLSAYSDEPLRHEVLLLKSIYAPEVQPRIGIDLEDLIIGCMINSIPQDIPYNNELLGISPECDWCHAKITNGPLPSLDTNDTLSRSQYDFTHQILWATDFSRSPTINSSIVTSLISRINLEIDLDLLAEYYLCLIALGQTITVNDISSLLNWFDNTWDGTKNHTALVVAVLLARIG